MLSVISNEVCVEGEEIVIRTVFSSVERVKRPGISVLSPRERDVFSEIILGHSDKEIAKALHISCSTVGFHITRILAKCHVRSRAELISTNR